ncbi:MAG: cobyric acid synthase [Opitutales bacterium]
MKGTCISILGTASDVGKSVLATALCRILKNRGYSVAPFKAQNMSNNSFVTATGEEMGRAQVAQAEACGLHPCADMNPVLLKPSGDCESQVVVQGHVIGRCNARDYFKDTSALFDRAMESLERLRSKYDIVVMEGAGSCAEVNLRSRDFVNFPIARAVDASVILAADIERGGVFAQIVGTLEVVDPEDRASVKGFLINRFRGDAGLFSNGIEYLEQRTGRKIFGVVPHFHDIRIDQEDGVAINRLVDRGFPEGGSLNIAVICLPRMSNQTDFDALERTDGINVNYLGEARDLKDYQLCVLPGSKNVRGDLKWLLEEGWGERLKDFVGRGGHLAGICGGYQMLGQTITDPKGVEDTAGHSEGLGLLPVHTVLGSRKELWQVTGRALLSDASVFGYEIHMGATERSAGEPAFELVRADGSVVADGCVAADGRVWGSYVHGLFDSASFRNELLRRFNPAFEGPWVVEDYPVFKERQYDALAAHVEAAVDVDALLEAVGK